MEIPWLVWLLNTNHFAVDKQTLADVGKAEKLNDGAKVTERKLKKRGDISRETIKIVLHFNETESLDLT